MLFLWYILYVVMVKLISDNSWESLRILSGTCRGFCSRELPRIPRIKKETSSFSGIPENSQEFLACIIYNNNNIIYNPENSHECWCKLTRKNFPGIRSLEFPGMILGNDREIPGFSREISHEIRRYWVQIPALALGRALNTWLELGVSRLLSYILKEIKRSRKLRY